MQYIVALDQGTTSSRAVVFDSVGQVVAAHSIEFAQLYPQPGWVEQDPFDILDSQSRALRQAVQKAGIDAADIAAIGIANQRETALLWERKTGKPVCNAIVWQCRRTAEICHRLQSDGLEDTVRARTGLKIDAYFSATKIQWMLDTLPGAREAAEAGELCFGTVDTWLLWNFAKGHPHVTDVSNASRTMLYNIHALDWDETLLQALHIPAQILPRVVATSGNIGLLDVNLLGREIPIAAIAGDQQAALFGQACFTPGMTKNTYGTGCFLLMQTGATPVESKNRLLTTIAWDIGQGAQYALEGSVFVGGAVVQWLRDEMGLIQNAAQSEEVALSVPDTQGVVFVPAFTGLGAPYWDMEARGTLVGLTRGAGRAHIVRAALESIAFQVCDVLRAMEADSGLRPSVLRVDGGASANRFLLQFQADLMGGAVVRAQTVETTAFGAAMLAGLAVGMLQDTAEISALWQASAVLSPNMKDAQRKARYAQWTRAVRCALSWADAEST